MKLYVLGGRQKRRIIKGDDDEHRFESALIIRLDTETEKSEIVVDYKTPEHARADADSSSLFTSGTLCGGELMVCTYTEVLVYKVPEFQLVTYISLPCFNALHHVCQTHEGNLLVANTGLDMVTEISPAGKVLREWSVLGESPWQRFSKDIDYRKIASTKPHRSHANFVFQIGADVWVTRFLQKDAICLTAPDRRIEIGVERPHDGVMYEGKLYFTTVDGHLLVVDPDTLRKTEVIDLKAARGNGRIPGGWCRGIMPVDKRRVWVGFTRIRKTIFMENLMWMKHGLHETEAPTHIALYDVAEKKCLKEIELEHAGMNILFGILPAA
jgi:hypothetical protein